MLLHQVCCSLQTPLCSLIALIASVTVFAITCILLPAEELCTLVITEAFPEDSGRFKCVALNSFGTVSCSAVLQVCDGLTLISLPRLVSGGVVVGASLTP